MLLTENEILDIYKQPSKTLMEFARGVELAVLEKLREQNEPVAWADETGYVWPNDDKHIKSNIPLYLNPAPIPEGWQLMPIDPSKEILAAMQSSGWMPGNYKAMLAARSGE